MRRATRDRRRRPREAGRTLDFVFSRLAIDSGDGPAAGFNLDFRHSTADDANGCHIPDHVSDIDTDQNRGDCQPGPNCQGGVDNLLPEIADALDGLRRTDIRADLAAQLAAGAVVLLLRVSGVTSVRDDPAVTVSLFRGFSLDTDCARLFSGHGRFVVSNESLLAAGQIGTARHTTSGRIVDGRLRARFGVDPKLSPEAAIVLPPFTDAPGARSLPVYQVQLRATLSQSGLIAESGNLGGWSRASELRDALGTGLPTLLTASNGLVALLADLRINGGCRGTFNEPRAGVGLGMRFELTSAIILGSARAPQSGACGSSPAGGAAR